MARDTQINLRVSADEASDMAEAAADAGMSLSEWARLVLLYTAGRPIAEQLDRAAEVGNKLFSAELGKTLQSARKAPSSTRMAKPTRHRMAPPKAK